jgi:hypothetical protein
MMNYRWRACLAALTVLTIALSMQGTSAVVASATKPMPPSPDVSSNGPTDIASRGNSEYFNGSTVNNSAQLASFPASCGLLVEYPHGSTSYLGQIHTRITSSCNALRLMTNTIAWKAYANTWVGWWLQNSGTKTASAPSATVQNFRVTAVTGCTHGETNTFRTEAFGTIVAPHATYTTSVYEQNQPTARAHCY